MDLDREWFETFFLILGLSSIPACFGLVALAFPQGPKVEGKKGKIYPRELETIGAAVVRVCGFNIVFLWAWGFLVTGMVSGHYTYIGLSFIVVWMVILITSTVMALIGALSLSGRSKSITAIGVLYFLLGGFQALMIARMLLG